MRALAIVLAMALGASAAWAQSAGLDLRGGDMPIEVEAENGIEWQQENQVFVARGNARASRGDVAVHADELRAFYREKDGGGTEVMRLDAVGNVRIESAKGGAAFGETGVFDVDKSVLVLRGKKVRFESGADVITADRQLEYYSEKKMAVARGNAMARRADKTLKTDVLVAHLVERRGKTEVDRVEAFDNVVIHTEKDTVHADRGVYNVESGIAVLTGSVRIDRSGNLLVGCRAEVNLNTGVSKLSSCADAGRRVQGVIQPGAVKQPR